MMDSRAQSKERIEPPHPLPHVSRRALKRVTNLLPPPTECPYCQGPVRLVNNSEVYGREYGDWPFAYLCAPCDAYVGLHPHTDIPLGTLADRHLRAARKGSKAAFHRMMNKLSLSRDEAYYILAAKLGIKQELCHFGWFDRYWCGEAKRVCVEYLNERG